jgi:hypothetical protein
VEGARAGCGEARRALEKGSVRKLEARPSTLLLLLLQLRLLAARDSVPLLGEAAAGGG